MEEILAITAILGLFLSDYTSLRNVLVLAWVCVLVLEPPGIIQKVAISANVACVVTFYIMTVGISNYLLFGFPPLKWINLIEDTLVHAVIPLLIFIFWFAFANKEEFSLVPF
jgi:hypothetical protein